jgi:hypothetical protein
VGKNLSKKYVAEIDIHKINSWLSAGRAWIASFGVVCCGNAAKLGGSGR